jgi:hypothetical protein
VPRASVAEPTDAGRSAVLAAREHILARPAETYPEEGKFERWRQLA